MSAPEEEPGVLARVRQAIAAWVPVLRRFVMFSGSPDPTGVEDAQPAWTTQLDRVIMPALETVVNHGWRWQAGQPFISSNSFAQAQLALTYNLLVRLPNDVYNAIFAEISTGTANGESMDVIADRIEATLLTSGSEWWENRAKVIARTETNRAWNAGVLAAAQYYQPPAGRGWMKVWDTDVDGHERPAHKRAEGQARSLSDTFQVGGEDLRFPGDPAGSPANVINCVTGSTQIVAPQILAAYRYWNNGPTLSILTAQGRILTVSPNHPVLTVQGWVLACQLVQGDNLVSHRIPDHLTGLEPHVQAQPVMAQDVFDALDLAWPGKWVSGLDVDFHGDRPQGEVKVVLPDRELDFGIEATDAEQVKKFLLSCAGAPNPGGCPSLQPRLPLRGTPDGLVSFEDLVGLLLGGHLGPLQGLGLPASSNGYSGLKQPASDDRATDSELLGEEVDGLSALVSIDQVVDIKIDPVHGGFLYTFQTASGAYLSNAIVSHNCRCSMTIKKGS